VETLQVIDRIAVQSALDRIRPYVQRDGGDIVLVEIDGTHARVRLTGNCADGSGTARTLCLGVEHWLREQVPGLEGIVID
jgi:Fe-S cluster biogenesis protein NfuA